MGGEGEKYLFPVSGEQKPEPIQDNFGTKNWTDVTNRVKPQKDKPFYEMYSEENIKPNVKNNAENSIKQPLDNLIDLNAQVSTFLNKNLNISDLSAITPEQRNQIINEISSKLDFSKVDYGKKINFLTSYATKLGCTIDQNHDLMVAILKGPTASKTEWNDIIKWLKSLLASDKKEFAKDTIGKYYGLREIIQWGMNRPKGEENSGWNKKNIEALSRRAGVSDIGNVQAVGSLQANIIVKDKLIDGLLENKENLSINIDGIKHSESLNKNHYKKIQDKYPSLMKFFDGLSEEEIKNINTISDEQFDHILPDLVKDIRNKVGYKSEDPEENISNLVNKLQKRLEAVSVIRDKFFTILGQEKGETFIKKAVEEEKKAAEGRGEVFDEKSVSNQEKITARAFQLAKKDDKLTKEQQAQLETITVEYYQNTKDHIDYTQIRSKDMLDEVKTSAYQNYEQTNQSLPTNTSFDRLKTSILADQDITTFFDKQEHKVSQDVFKETNQSALLKFDTRPIPDQFKKYFDAKGELNQEQYKTASNPDKKAIDNFQEKRVSTTKEVLATDTNTLIKRESVNLCVDTLKSLFNIKIRNHEEIESRLDSFKNVNEQGENKLHNNKLILKGDINGKQIFIYYNLETGRLATKDFLAKPTKQSNESDFVLNDPSSRKVLDEIHMPTLKDAAKSAQDISYADVVQRSEGDTQRYNRNIQKEFYDKMSSKLPTPDQKSIFEKQMLKNMTAQDVCKMIGIDKQAPRRITKDQQKAHTMFQYIYESINTYSQEQLRAFRRNIRQYKALEKLQKSDQNISENKEHALIQKLTQDKEKAGESYMGEPFLDFMNLMRNDDEAKHQHHIIDIDKFSGFLDRSQQIQPDYTKVSSSYLNQIDSVIAPLQADQQLDEQLNIAYE